MRFLTSMFFLLFFFTISSGYSQDKRAAIWHVGNKKLDFTTNPINISALNSPLLGVNFNCANLCQNDGQHRLFYSMETGLIYNTDYQSIPESDKIVGKGWSNWLSDFIFVPVPANDSLVYLINSATYTLIDTKNNQLVSLNQKWNNYTDTIQGGGISIIEKANCIDYWIFVNNDSTIYATELTTSGFGESFKVFSYESNTEFSSFNQFLFSHTGDYFVLIKGANSIIDVILGHVNRQTAQMTLLDDCRLFDINLNSAEISNNDNFLYLYFDDRNDNTTKLVQYPIVNDTIQHENAYTVFQPDYLGLNRISQLVTGIDGRIYQIFLYHDRINIINNPDKPGSACNYQENAISFKGFPASAPNFVRTWTSETACKPNFYVDNVCWPESIYISVSLSNQLKSVEWDFGDGKSSTALQPEHNYQQPGVYQITMEAMLIDDTKHLVTKTITVYEKPLKPTILHE